MSYKLGISDEPMRGRGGRGDGCRAWTWDGNE